MWLDIRYIVTIFFIGIFTYVGFSKEYQPEYINPISQKWRWNQFPSLEGKGIRSIYEDSQKTIWMASNAGLLEYNGYEWKIHDETNGLDKTPIELVCGSKDGVIWAVSNYGIYKLSNEHWVKVLTIPDSLPFQFHTLKELKNGIIAASSDQGLVLIDDDVRIISTWNYISRFKTSIQGVKWIPLPNEVSTSNDFLDVSDVILDRNDQFWIGITLDNEQGLILNFDLEELDQPTIENYQIHSSNSTIQLGESQRFLEDRSGAIWVVNNTYKTGISIYKDGVWSYTNLSDYFSGDEYMTDIVESDDGTIWVASLGKLYTFKNGVWQLYSAPDFPIPANRIILQKSSGQYIWIAGFKSRVFYLDYSTDHWVSYKNLNFQFQDETNSLWFITIDGEVAVKNSENKWTLQTHTNGLIEAPIRLFQTSQGQIWAAGSHHGVAATALFSNGKWEKFVHPELSWGIDYRAVFEDNSGALWFGGAVDAESDKGQKGGIVKLADPLHPNKQWIHYKPSEKGLHQSNLYGIGQSEDGQIWIGGGNLYGFDGERWERHQDTRLQQFVNVVCSGQGYLLAGSRYYGVFMNDGNDWIHYDNTNGLSGNTIISMDIVSPSCIYVATENDICRYDGNSWVQNVFPSELNMEFEGGMLLHDNDGAIWINKSSRAWKRRAFSHSKTQKGQHQYFESHKYFPDRIPPETNITLYSSEVSSSGDVLIKWCGNDYFEQSAESDLMFSYKLGDDAWSEYTSEKHHTFMSLKSGDYTLQVKSRDLDLNVDSTPATIHFTVLPPVWKQTWFISLLAAFLTILIIFEYRVISKKQKLEALNKSLQQANHTLQIKSKKIEYQNHEILNQQNYIINQAKGLEEANRNLAERNEEIKSQKDQLEKLVVKNEQLSKAKLGFFTNISHELRTPLTLLTGPIQQLIQKDNQISSSSRMRLYQIIQRNSSRLHKLINQLLELRKIEHSNLGLEYTSVRLSDFLKEIVGLFEILAIENGIFLEFDANLTSRKYNVDKDKLEKVVVNLLSNAFKHTPPGESITLTVTDIPGIDHKGKQSQAIEIAVEDTGAGIAKDELDKIFKRFYCSDPNGDKDSTGIGLSYINELVHVMNGHIEVDSVFGKGSRFVAFIPCPLIEEASPQNSWTSTPSFSIAKQETELLRQSFSIESNHVENESLSVQKILVVDDNPDMVQFVSSILVPSYHVMTAGYGEEALIVAKNNSIDLIVSDVMMPGMNGYELCNLIKSDLTTSHIPVLLLTAKVLEENKIAGYNEGADGYMTKPFHPEVLLARVENLLQQREKLKEVFNRDYLLTPQEIQLSGPDEELLRHIVDIMEENIDNPNFNVNQMCKMVHLSHMHFIRKVKQLTGKKPLELLKAFRLKRAKDLLIQNKLTISEVAFMVGYDLPNSFSRAFKKEFGMSPKEYVAAEAVT